MAYFCISNVSLTRYGHSPLRISVQYMLQDKQPCCVAVSKLSATGSWLTVIQLGEGKFDRAQDRIYILSVNI